MELIFKPSPKQFQAWQYLTDRITTETGYGGAAFGGKSYLGSFWQLSNRIAYPGTAGLLGRKDLINLKRTTLLTFFKVCAEYGIKPGEHYTYNQQNNTITFWNGSVEFLFDLSYQPSDPLYTRLGGLELTDAFVDESNEVPVQAINILKTRIGRRLNDKYGLLPKLLEGFNPDKGHVYSRYYKPWKDGILPPHMAFVQALPTDNPSVTEEYLNQLRNSDPVTRERLLFGNFEYDDDPTALIEYDAIQDLFTNHVPESTDKHLIVDAARFGGDKIVFTRFKGLRAYKITWKQKQGTDQTEEDIKKILQDELIPRSHTLVDEDGVGGGIVDHLKGIKGFTANNTPLEVWDTQKMKFVPANFENLKAQCSYKLAEMVNNREMAVDCEDPQIREWLTQELEWIKSKDADKDGKRKIMPKDEVKEHLGRSPDFADTLMMRMYFELKKKRPITAPTTVQGGVRPLIPGIG